MTKILLIDTNAGFTTDVESRLILDSIDETDIVIGTNFDNVSADIAKEQPTELLISARIIPIRSDWDLGLPIKCYAKSKEDIALANEKGIPCYGIMNTAKELLAAIESKKTIEVTPTNVASTPNAAAPEPITVPKAMSVSQQNIQQQNVTYQSTPQTLPASQEDRHNNDLFSAAESQSASTIPNPAPVVQSQGEPVYNPMQQTPRQEPQATPFQNTAAHETTPYGNAEQIPVALGAVPLNNSEQISTPVTQPTPDNQSVRARLQEAKRREQEEERLRAVALRKQQEENTTYAVEQDMGNIQPPARVITIYSAKGGVGKTTLACELATFLALTSHGRGKFKVCIVDFNIDFGDVLNTLSFNPERSCMTYWAADIQSKMQMGVRPEDITYTEAQISVYLQQNENDGLYALIAPLTNEDSMDITEQQMEIMLDSLIKNGGFDFVICDTGNNTRDSSIISLEKADEVLLVITQDVNTVNCNESVLSTMHKIGFDMNKFRLVINKARPAKTVAISTDELTEVFINPLNNQPYPCIAKIKDDNEIKQANNLGEPLVYHSSHDFTKSIGEIAKEVIGDNFVLGKPEKKGFFGRLFGGNKKKKEKKRKK